MDKDKINKIIWQMISVIDDLPIGCEILDGCINNPDENVWDVWNEFKSEM